MHTSTEARRAEWELFLEARSRWIRDRAARMPELSMEAVKKLWNGSEERRRWPLTMKASGRRGAVPRALPALAREQVAVPPLLPSPPATPPFPLPPFFSSSPLAPFSSVSCPPLLSSSAHSVSHLWWSGGKWEAECADRETASSLPPLGRGASAAQVPMPPVPAGCPHDCRVLGQERPSLASQPAGCWQEQAATGPQPSGQEPRQMQA